MSRQAFAGVPFTIVNIRSLVLDGDVPIVSFDVHDPSNIYSYVVRMDDQVIDLGYFDADTTFYAVPRPLLAMPGGDPPLVAWIDPVSGGPDAGLVVRLSQRWPDGWEPFAAPLTLPTAGQTHPHALLWDATAARAPVAAPAVGPSDTVATVAVRAANRRIARVRSGSRSRSRSLRRPGRGPRDGPRPDGRVRRRHRRHAGDLSPRITVARVRP